MNSHAVGLSQKVTEMSEYKKLAIFDFDGTIFRSPISSKENMDKYERATGIPWIISKEKSR